MSILGPLRHLLAVAGVAGSLLPGAGLPATVTPAPRGALTHDTSVLSPTVALVYPSALRRTWSWPLSSRPSVVAPFVAPRSTYGAGHRGIDLSAVQGQDVRAVDDGVVTHVGVIAGRGTVSVTHASGLRSTYEPIRGVVRMGAAVHEGQVIGTIAGRSHCGGSCLHLGALRGAGYVDPRPLLPGGRVILLPLKPGS